MNLPNSITMSRICCIPLLIWMLSVYFPFHSFYGEQEMVASLLFILASITDGTSNTLMLGERPPAADRSFGWWSYSDYDNLLATQNYINLYPNCPTPGVYGPGKITNNCDSNHFWSLHTGGGNWLFGDGSVHFLPYASAALTVPLATRPAAEDPYRGLFDLPYLAASLRVLMLTMVLGGLFFLLLPRQAGATRARTSGAMNRHLTGFDEKVKLGQLGEILENDSVVMSVEFTDEQNKSIQPRGEPLWRGVTLTSYEKGEWQWHSQQLGRLDF